MPVSTWRSTPTMPQPWPNGSRTGERCSSATGPRSRSATTARDRTMCCRPWARPPTVRAWACTHSSRSARSSTMIVGPWPKSPNTSTLWPPVNSSRPTAGPSTSGSRSRDALSVLSRVRLAGRRLEDQRRRRRDQPAETVPPLRSPLHDDGGHESVGDQTLRGDRGVLAAEDHVGCAQGLPGAPGQRRRPREAGAEGRGEHPLEGHRRDRCRRGGAVHPRSAARTRPGRLPALRQRLSGLRLPRGLRGRDRFAACRCAAAVLTCQVNAARGRAKLAQMVEENIRSKGIAEIDADEVGLSILDPLRELDQVAYLRFASVYQGFDSLEDFEAAIDSLRADALLQAGQSRQPLPEDFAD